MSEQIWKYQFDVQDEFSIEMPESAEIMSVQTQRGIPCMWVRVKSSLAGSVTRHFLLRGTGQNFTGDEGEHIATFQMHDEGLVFHVFRHREVER